MKGAIHGPRDAASRTVLMLDGSERAEIARQLDELRRCYSAAGDPDLLFEAPVLARQLPARVQHFLNLFRRGEWGYALITGHAGDDAAYGPTPRHWNALPSPSPTLDRDVLLVLYAALLGDAFAWNTQQDGRVVHDVLPIKENEGQQLGTAADVDLCWHTEDAFHPLRPDWVILSCIRNPGATPTIVASSDDLVLDERDVEVLFEERFRILPDCSHMPSQNSKSDDVDFSRINQMQTDPPVIALMSGDVRRPYIRADESFWSVADPADEEAAGALARLAEQIRAHMQEVVLRPGDVCLIDNFKAVHGRKRFEARYDGTDRWLKRVCVTRDLRKSRAARPDLVSHVIG